MSLDHTGERVVVEHYRSTPSEYVIYLMHIAAYRFALPYVRDKRVLDLGCGSGYGSFQIAEVAATVDAVDVADDAVRHAQKNHPRSNLHFQTIEPEAALPFADGSFDIVMSFQVIEHLRAPDRYLAEARRVLAPGGCLLLATPDRRHRLLPRQRPWNRWHVHEYDAAALEHALRRHFPVINVLTMSGRADVIGIELRRYRRLKWLTLPFTLPFVPDSLRLRGLNLLHALRTRSSRTAAPYEFGFDESALQIGPNLHPSLNLVAVAYADRTAVS